MSFRFLTASALLVLVASFSVRAEDGAEARVINLVPSVSGASLFPLKNPGVVTLGTLSILNRIDFAISAFTTNGNGAGGTLSYLWNWGDGTPDGTGPFPNHTYVVAGTYNVTVTTTESGNPTPKVSTLSVTVTDAVKSIRLQTNENFITSNGNDSLNLRGVLHIPTGVSPTGALAFVDIGGVQYSFILNDKGSATLTTNANVVINPATGTSTTIATSCKATLKINIRKRQTGVAFVDAPFVLISNKSTITPALADETITNRMANRDNVRITVKVTLFNILFQTGVNQLFTNGTNGKGKTR